MHLKKYISERRILEYIKNIKFIQILAYVKRYRILNNKIKCKLLRNMLNEDAIGLERLLYKAKVMLSNDF